MCPKCDLFFASLSQIHQQNWSVKLRIATYQMWWFWSQHPPIKFIKVKPCHFNHYVSWAAVLKEMLPEKSTHSTKMAMEEFHRHFEDAVMSTLRSCPWRLSVRHLKAKALRIMMHACRPPVYFSSAQRLLHGFVCVTKPSRAFHVQTPQRTGVSQAKDDVF